MPIIVFDTAPPPEQITSQVLQLMVNNVTSLHLMQIPRANLQYDLYAWALPCELLLYMERIGVVPDAPTELLVALDEQNPEQVIGFCLYLPVPTHPDACGLTYMAVSGSHRRRGIGRALLKRVIDRYPHVELTCAVDTVEFYERVGFRVIDSHLTQVVMNTRSASCTGMMHVLNTAPIYETPQARAIQQQLINRYGLAAMQQSQIDLEQHAEALQKSAQLFVSERLAMRPSAATQRSSFLSRCRSILGRVEKARKRD